MGLWVVERCADENRQKKIWIWNWKVLFLSLGITIILSVVMLNSSSFVVGFWNWVSSSPPLYIYIIVNSMVLLIALLSKFHPHPPPPQPHPQVLLSTTQNSPTTSSSYHHHVGDHNDYISEVKTEADQASSENELDEGEKQQEEDGEDDTMEATWKAISGKKQLTKSETFIIQTEESSASAPATASWKDLKKSETFNEAVSIRRRGGMRRDPSVGIDEFNQKVEAFIKKFNDDMRLQRQQSDQRFIDMINRGL